MLESIAERAQGFQQIAGQQPTLALARSQIARARVQANTHPGGIPCGTTLRHQCGNDAGQEISHTATAHARISPCTDVQTSIWISNKASRTFQYDNRVIALCQSAGRGKPIQLDLRNLFIEQPRRLAGVRRQYGGSCETARFTRKEIESVGIQHQRFAAIERGEP